MFFLVALTHKANSEESKNKVFKAGAATSNITPPLGSPVAGAGSTVPTNNVHDELHARALILDDGKTRFALVVCDSSGISATICEKAREFIAANETIQIAPENVMISATHTHSGPNANADNYRDFLARRIADSVQRAVSNLQPAKIGWGSVDEPSELFNRRWYVNDSALLQNPFGCVDKVVMNPPRGSKALVQPAGPIDPEVSFLSVQSLEGKPIALFANYSLHYVGGAAVGEISADYFGMFANRMGELLRAESEFPPFVGIMSNGTSGDVNNSDRRKKSQRRAPYEKMKEVAEKLAQGVAKAHQGITFHDWVPLGAASRKLPLKPRKADKNLMEYAAKILERPDDVSGYPRYALKYAAYVERMGNGDYRVPDLIQVFRIGDLGIAAIPYETFTETGLRIKAESPFQDSFTIELANGAGGYLPTPEQHKLGGYETWFGTNRVQMDASEVIVEAILSMMEELNAE
ncbi:MAG: neutral/alkaline non-lysosomal ceramidase N-terminal domain-containing protein [Verrucomicrobiota bacterium]